MTYYDVYLRNEEGKRGAPVNGIVSITNIFRRNEPVKWTLTGAGLEECPIADGSEIVQFAMGRCCFADI